MMVAWNVLLDGEEIDIVWFSSECDEDYVRNSLINHDGYHPNISVCREV